MIIKLDMSSEIPIYQQLRNQIVIGIANGTLQNGEKLPTVRQLAIDLGVNTMTVNKAYGLLKQENYIEIDRRHGAKVTHPTKINKDKIQQLESQLILVISELKLHQVDLEQFQELSEMIYNNFKNKKGM